MHVCRVGGGFSADQFFSLTFPVEWAERHHISRLEAINIVIAVKTLIPSALSPYKLCIKTDNIASAQVLMTGKTQDTIMAACARELARHAIEYQIEIDIEHTPGRDLVLADALSRCSVDPAMQDKARVLVTQMCLKRADTCDLTSIIDMYV